MSVRQRSGGWQADVCYKGSRFRQDGFPSKLEAEQWERTARTRLENGQPLDGAETPTHPTTLKALAERVTALVWKGQRSEDTSVKNADDVVAILGGDRDPKTVTTATIDAMVEEFQRKGFSNATINRKLAALSKMLHFAKQRGWVASVPHIERRKESEHRIRWVSEEEEKKIERWFKFTNQQSMIDLVQFLMDTGLRLAEAVGDEKKRHTGVAWTHVRTKAEGRMAVDVPPLNAKSGKLRTIPLTPRVREIVERRRKAAPQDTERLFHDLDYWGVEYAWRTMREHIEMDHDPQFIIHVLRHTFGSRLAQKGVAIQTIQKLMGHANVQTTMRYAHLHDTALEAAVEVLA
jgi:integrase